MREVGIDADVKDLRRFYIQSAICEHQLNWEKHIVIEACINRSGNTAPPRVIQACTESLDRKILQGNERFLCLLIVPPRILPRAISSMHSTITMKPLNRLPVTPTSTTTVAYSTQRNLMTTRPCGTSTQP